MTLTKVFDWKEFWEQREEAEVTTNHGTNRIANLFAFLLSFNAI